MIFEVLTLFPKMFDGIISDSILKRAREKGLISVNTTDIRQFSQNKHNRVDDSPYGGDPGMVMNPEPLIRASNFAKEKMEGKNPKVVFMTPHGVRFNHSVAAELANEESLILLCGHYKGIDYRVREKYVDMEISIGDFVLSGGEIAAMTVIDSVSRLIPGVLGNDESAGRDSHYDGLLSAPCYTRPEEFDGMKVPEVLLSGNHKKIEEWHREMSIKLTQEKRPDLWEKYIENN
jgi:tRNA (guanine37-N1)-methyltransferase